MKMKDEEWKAQIISIFKGDVEVYDDKEENLRFFYESKLPVKLFLVKNRVITPYLNNSNFTS